MTLKTRKEKPGRIVEMYFGQRRGIRIAPGTARDEILQSSSGRLDKHLGYFILVL
jgi:hypothetical protein